MAAAITIIIGFFQIVFFVLCGVALVYFILKRIKDKQDEKFEQRDN